MTRVQLAGLALCCWFLAVPSTAATIKVKAGDATPDLGGCGSGANPCDTIQAGVDNASPGDVVKVAKGEYAEEVVVSTAGITIKGGTIVDTGVVRACSGDPTRTAEGRCNEIGNQPQCEATWHITGETPAYAASCYWDAGDTRCRGCGPNNEGDGNCTNSCDGTLPAAVRIEASGVTLDKLRVRGAPYQGIAVEPGGSGATLKGVRVEATGLSCIDSQADGTTVLSANLRSCDEHCVSILGDDALVSKSRIRSCGRDGVHVEGQRLSVERNRFELADSDSIDARGDDLVIERNRFRNTSYPIYLTSGAGSVLRNKISSSYGTGIEVECSTYRTSCEDASRTVFAGGPNTEACDSFADQPSCESGWALSFRGAASCYWDADDPRCRGCGQNNEEDGNCTNSCIPVDRCGDLLVASNVVTDSTDDPCFDFDAEDAGLRVEKNKGSYCKYEGVDVQGVGIEFVGNSITDCGSDTRDPGFYIDGADHFFERNKVQRCAGDGFFIDEFSTGVTLDRNQAIDNGADGFDVEPNAMGTTLVDAVAKNNILNGIAVRSGAVDTSVTGSSATGSLVDFCDEGTGTMESGNKFGTTSPTCVPSWSD